MSQSYFSLTIYSFNYASEKPWFRHDMGEFEKVINWNMPCSLFSKWILTSHEMICQKIESQFSSLSLQVHLKTLSLRQQNYVNIPEINDT